MVQWKLCGLTTCTSTTDTASPSARPAKRADQRPGRAFAGDHGQDLPAREAQVREQAELLAPRQHLRAEAGGDAEQADADRHRLQPVGDGEAAVEDAQRRLRASRAAEANSSSGAAGAGGLAQRLLHLRRVARRARARQLQVVDARVAGEALVVAAVQQHGAGLPHVVAPDAGDDEAAAACRGRQPERRVQLRQRGCPGARRTGPPSPR